MPPGRFTVRVRMLHAVLYEKAFVLVSKASASCSSENGPRPSSRRKRSMRSAFFLHCATVASGLLLMPFGLGAQSVDGRVVGDSSRKPIIGVHVVLVDSVARRAVDSTDTDSAGVFFLQAPRPGTYALAFERRGLTPYFSRSWRFAQDAAQQGIFTLPETDSIRPFPANAVDERATSLRSNPAPRYPSELRQHEVEGNAVVRLILDPAGRVVRSSIHILVATAPEFGAAVEASAVAWRFVPARKFGRQVYQVACFPTTFRLTSGDTREEQRLDSPTTLWSKLGDCPPDVEPGQPDATSRARTLQGRAIDSASRAPVVKMWVDVRPSTRDRWAGAWTDSAGAFRVNVPPAIVYVVRFSLPDGSAILADSVAPEMFIQPFVVPFSAAQHRHMYFDFEVDQRAIPIDRRPPAYPVGVTATGEVLVQIAIDSLGKPDPATFKAIRSPHPALTGAAERALFLWKFQPARKAGRPVRQLVQIPFAFRPP